MTCYGVIDTNVIVSALLSRQEEAATVQLVGRLLGGEIIPVYSRDIMAEYRQVLARKKFRFDPQVVADFLLALERFGVLAEPSAAGILLPDEKDLPFYEVVLAERDRDAYLVTGNLRHFPREPFIVTPRQMLDILDGRV